VREKEYVSEKFFSFLCENAVIVIKIAIFAKYWRSIEAEATYDFASSMRRCFYTIDPKVLHRE